MSKYMEVEERDYEKYSNPKLPPSSSSILKYDRGVRESLEDSHNVNIHGVPVAADYPERASFSRIPIKINCPNCNKLTMTDTEYENGSASKIWCFLLLPFFCTGCCCLCLNSCKDVRHICS